MSEYDVGIVILLYRCGFWVGLLQIRSLRAELCSRGVSEVSVCRQVYKWPSVIVRSPCPALPCPALPCAAPACLAGRVREGRGERG